MLFNVYSFADAVFWFSSPGTRSLHHTHTPVFLPVAYCFSLLTTFLLAPCMVIYGNILFRMPPFVDEMDLETIAEVAKLGSRAGAPKAADATETEPLVDAGKTCGAELAVGTIAVGGTSA